MQLKKEVEENYPCQWN